MTKSELLVLLDADVILNSKTTINELVKPYIKNRKIGLIGGNPFPVVGRSIIEKGINLTFKTYYPLRKLIKNGNNPFGFDGKIMAISKQIYNGLIIPSHMIGTDSYLYFLCKVKHIKTFHAENATVLYRSPDNLSDHIKQNTRFIAAERIHKNVFGDIVLNEYKIPFFLKINMLLRSAQNNLFLTLLMIFVNTYTRYKASTLSVFSRWDIAVSTKGEIK